MGEKMNRKSKKLILCKKSDLRLAFYSNITVGTDDVAVSDTSRPAVICFGEVDCGESGHLWDRITIDCTLGEDSMLRVWAAASDDGSVGGEDIDALIASDAGEDEKKAALYRIFGAPVSSCRDFLANCRGRRLRLMLELSTVGGAPPRLQNVAIHFDADHMIDYLPAVYRENGEFTRRFLSVFNSLFIDMDARIDALPSEADPDNTDPETVERLARWTFINTVAPGASVSDLRGYIKNSREYFSGMYTRAGICESVRRLCGRVPFIIENSDVNCDRPDCPDPELYRRLYGDSIYRFFILLGDDTFPDRAAVDSFISNMEECIPANTEMSLILLSRSISLDRHTYLGINTYVSDYTPLAVDGNSPIHYDSMIGG